MNDRTWLMLTILTKSFLYLVHIRKGWCKMVTERNVYSLVHCI
uniref:Uncharacterized protein n=1 Tax=Rhizophora mucronata TaxID=61149 RepID=A0A2P2Q470_RHIMU